VAPSLGRVLGLNTVGFLAIKDLGVSLSCTRYLAGHEPHHPVDEFPGAAARRLERYTRKRTDVTDNLAGLEEQWQSNIQKLRASIN
jgi:hypothetical protein